MIIVIITIIIIWFSCRRKVSSNVFINCHDTRENAARFWRWWVLATVVKMWKIRQIHWDQCTVILSLCIQSDLFLSATQQTHNVATTSLQRRCNVTTLQRRCNVVVRRVCVCWVFHTQPLIKLNCAMRKGIFGVIRTIKIPISQWSHTVW